MDKKNALSLLTALFLGLQLINSVSAADKIPVISNAPGPSITFTASPSTISIGDSSKLEWNSPSADSCKFVGGSWFGLGDASIPTSGNKVVSPSKDTIYKIYCTNKSGTLPSEVTVNVNRCPAGNSCHGATLDLKIDGSHGPVKLSHTQQDKPGVVSFIGDIRLTSTVPWWAIFNPRPIDCVSWDNGIRLGVLEYGVPYDISGTLSATDYGSHILTVSCNFDRGGDVIRDSVNVVIEKPTTQQVQTVTPTTTSTPASIQAPTVNLSVSHTDTPNIKFASSITIPKGKSAILSWTSTNAKTCSASGGWSGGKSTTPGSQTVSPASTTKYTLTCTGPGGSATDYANVTVTPYSFVPTHFTCVNNACTSVPGDGTDQCATNSDCGSQPPKSPASPSVDIWIKI